MTMTNWIIIFISLKEISHIAKEVGLREQRVLTMVWREDLQPNLQPRFFEKGGKEPISYCDIFLLLLLLLLLSLNTRLLLLVLE